MNFEVDEEHRRAANNDVIIRPLSCLDEVLEWDAKSSSNLLTASVELKPTRSIVSPISPSLLTGNRRPVRTLVCHDMMGGYLEDRFDDHICALDGLWNFISCYIQGVATLNTYRFFHWSQVDIFVYFSHNFITIPPPVWIDAAHLHGVPILGTLITEGGGGYELCNKLLNNKDPYLLSRFVHKLVQIAEHYNFNGWLINIENKIQEENMKQLLNLIHWLTTQMHHAIPGSLVLWYDSILENGELKWQNELNWNNKIFFDACDGIYLNYNWNEELLKKSAKLAGDRIADVFAGVDVFGRGTFGGGGFDTDLALKAAQLQGLSVAIFAQGWTYEAFGQLDFLQNEHKFWTRLVDFTFQRVAVNLPFHSSFCHGFGRHVYRNGHIVHPKPWSNMSLQQYQVMNQGIANLKENSSSLSIYTEEAYQGGGCLLLSGTLSGVEHTTSFKIFRVRLHLNTAMQVSYATKCIIPHPDKLEICLDMTVVSSENCAKKWHYRLVQNDPEKIYNEHNSVISSQVGDEKKIILCPTVSFTSALVDEDCNGGFPINDEPGWTTRSFCITPDTEDAYITDLDLTISGRSSMENNNSKFEVLLGQIQVVPAELLLSLQLPLDVNCFFVETCRSPSMVEVTSLVNWSAGVTNNLVDSYDIFCRLKWMVNSSEETKGVGTVDSCIHWKGETYYVGSTRRNLYKINSFRMSSPEADKFHLQFIVRENVIGLVTKDIDESAYCEVTM